MGSGLRVRSAKSAIRQKERAGRERAGKERAGTRAPPLRSRPARRRAARAGCSWEKRAPPLRALTIHIRCVAAASELTACVSATSCPIWFPSCMVWWLKM